MYRWLLCARYLRTRYIALASIISVTLGVATLVVVNSVMAGFSAEMHERLHGLASDITIKCHADDGLQNPEVQVAKIRDIVGDELVGISCSVAVPAMLSIETHRGLVTRHVYFVGIDAATYDQVSDFGKYLIHPENQKRASFDLRENGYDTNRETIGAAGWGYRRRIAEIEKVYAKQAAMLRAQQESQQNKTPSLSTGPSFTTSQPVAFQDAETVFDAAKEQRSGIILGISTSSIKFRNEAGEATDYFHCRPGDDVRMMFPTAAKNFKMINERFTVVDFYESGMSEYDSSYAFCSLDDLQRMRGMIDPQTNTKSITTIQLRLTEDANLNEVRDRLQRFFPPETGCDIQTWRDMQGPLLSAVRLETTILNILLFLIIAVAGFGILATFFMIVVEKTRDIGTLKSLGASGGGVMSIFLSYGVLLGAVGSGAGLVGGLIFVHYINDIAALIERITGQEVFDPTIYYFTEIPTIIHPITLVWVTLGAIGIAVMASVLPALRAARMHPVQALRFE